MDILFVLRLRVFVRLLKKNDKANKMFNEMKNIKSLWEKFGLCVLGVLVILQLAGCISSEQFYEEVRSGTSGTEKRNE